MVDPASGPFLFDTSAESWLGRAGETGVACMVARVLVASRDTACRGHDNRTDSRLWSSVEGGGQAGSARQLPRKSGASVAVRCCCRGGLQRDYDVTTGSPPAPPRQSHQLTESRQERLTRWRFDTMIAATALVFKMPLIHNDTTDFEAIPSAIERSPQRFSKLGPLALICCGALV